MTYHSHSKNFPISLRIANLGQTPCNEEKTNDGQKDTDDKAEDSSVYGIVYAIEDGDSCPDTKNGVHADAARKYCFVRGPQAVRLQANIPAAAHPRTVALFPVVGRRWARALWEVRRESRWSSHFVSKSPWIFRSDSCGDEEGR